MQEAKRLTKREKYYNSLYLCFSRIKADIITIQSQELAEIIYSKYGRELKSKTSIVQFTINKKIYWVFVGDGRFKYKLSQTIENNPKLKIDTGDNEEDI